MDEFLIKIFDAVEKQLLSVLVLKINVKPKMQKFFICTFSNNFVKLFMKQTISIKA